MSVFVLFIPTKFGDFCRCCVSGCASLRCSLLTVVANENHGEDSLLFPEIRKLVTTYVHIRTYQFDEFMDIDITHEGKVEGNIIY